MVGLTTRRHIPATYESRDFVGSCLYGPNFPDMYRRAATYVDKILKGAKACRPACRAAHDVRINLKTAKTLGLTIPPALLQRADQPIE